MNLRVVALAVVLCAAAPVHAYNEGLHALLTARSFPQRTPWLAEPLQPPSEADLATFRLHFWSLAASMADPELRAAFVTRYPAPEALDAWSFKELFLLDPAARVHGFDPIPELAGPITRGVLLAQASRWPDDDQRNQHRYLHDGSRKVVTGGDGQPLPYDPATLDMGSLSGASSQAHAHYQLLPPPLSDDPQVLQRDPRHFAVPPTVRTWGADMAQLYADLAVVAWHSDLHHGREWLAATFAGAGYHHVEDVANQIHTVQVGIYDFFRDAYLQSLLRDATTLGGLLGPRWTLKDVGLRLVTNHHLFLEDLFARRMDEAAAGKPAPREVAAVAASLGEDDAELRERLQYAATRGEAYARMQVMALADVSSHEGPEAYRLAYALSAASLHRYAGHAYADGDDPDAFLDARGKDATLSAFYALESRGARRATTAVRAYEARLEQAFDAPDAARAAVERSVRFLLPLHREAAARRAAFRPAPAGRARIAWGWPAGAVALLGALWLGATRLRRRHATAAALR